ncbi:MAG: cytidine deaminase [Smithella sp.]
MEYSKIDKIDRNLIDAASGVLDRNYFHPRHTVGSAVLCSSGKIYTGVNIESVGYGPCAEVIAIGRAISEGERQMKRIVTVGGPAVPHKVISPCGNCRQLIVDYAPDCWVILPHDGAIMKIKAMELLPDAYRHLV